MVSKDRRLEKWPLFFKKGNGTWGWVMEGSFHVWLLSLIRRRGTA